MFAEFSTVRHEQSTNNRKNSLVVVQTASKLGVLVVNSGRVPS